MTTAPKARAEVLAESKDLWGNVERRYAGDVLLVPRPINVSKDGERLVWGLRRSRLETAAKRMRTRWRDDAVRGEWGSIRKVENRAKLLTRFVGLADGPPWRIEAFARRWGPLGLCAHNRPASHPLGGEEPIPARDGHGAMLSACWPRGWDGRAGWEPVEEWRRYARRARAVLMLAYVLRTGKKGDPAALEPLGRDLGLVLLGSGRLRGKGERQDVRPPDWWGLVAAVVNNWIRDGSVRPRLVLSGKVSNTARPRLALALAPRADVPEFGLFGVLGMQLAFAVSGEHGIAFCSVCGKNFEPGRQPRAGVRHYCPGCGLKAMQRVASADYRKRVRRKAKKRKRTEPNEVVRPPAAPGGEIARASARQAARRKSVVARNGSR